MKRSNDDKTCRRQEFVCRLYDVIKDLDRSLKSDCNQGSNRFAREQGNPFAPRPMKTALDNKRGAECCCPPGCCEDSMDFKLHRIPNYPGLENTQGQDGGMGYGGGQGQAGGMGYGGGQGQNGGMGYGGGQGQDGGMGYGGGQGQNGGHRAVQGLGAAKGYDKLKPSPGPSTGYGGGQGQDHGMGYGGGQGQDGGHRAVQGLGAAKGYDKLKPSPGPTSSAYPGNPNIAAHTAQGQEISRHNWHKNYHNNGCWSGHEHEDAGRGGQAGPSRARAQGPQVIIMPNNPEEAIAMGCFVARAA